MGAVGAAGGDAAARRLVGRAGGVDRRFAPAGQRHRTLGRHRGRAAAGGGRRRLACLARAARQPQGRRTARRCTGWPGCGVRKRRHEGRARALRDRARHAAPGALRRGGGGLRHPQARPAEPLDAGADRPLSVRAALVHDHRRARLRQDHGTPQRGPALSARRPHGRTGGARRRRHAQLRLVVHRPGGADRHCRPFHHAGQRRQQRQGDLGRLPATAEEEPPAPAAEWRARHGVGGRPDRPQPRRPRHPRAGRARAGAGAARTARPSVSDLPARHQVRSAVGLCRELRRTRQGPARHALGLHGADQRPFGAAVSGHRIRGAAGPPGPGPGRCVAGRARPAAPRTHLRLPEPVCAPARQPERLRAAGVFALAVRSRPDAARRVLRQRHAGRLPDRPRARCSVAPLQARAGDAAGAAEQRPQLLPVAPADRGGVRRAGLVRHAAWLRAPPWRHGDSRLCGAGAAGGRAGRRVGHQLEQQQGLHRCRGGSRRTRAQGRQRNPQPRHRRPAPRAAGAGGHAGPGSGRRQQRQGHGRCRRQGAAVAGLRPVPGAQARRRRAHRLRTHAGRRGDAAAGAACRRAVACRRPARVAVRSAQGLLDDVRARAFRTRRPEGPHRERLGRAPVARAEHRTARVDVRAPRWAARPGRHRLTDPAGQGTGRRHAHTLVGGALAAARLQPAAPARAGCRLPRVHHRQGRRW